MANHKMKRKKTGHLKANAITDGKPQDQAQTRIGMTMLKSSFMLWIGSKLFFQILEFPQNVFLKEHLFLQDLFNEHPQIIIIIITEECALVVVCPASNVEDMLVF